MSLTKTEAVGMLVDLAKQVELSQDFDFTGLRVTENELYEQMASSVLEQMYSVPEEHRETVMLGTLTKIMVENFLLTHRFVHEDRV